MIDQSASFFAEISAITQVFGLICQMSTAVVAVGIAMTTFCTKRQSALALVNKNQALALLNTIVIHAEAARATFAQLQPAIVGVAEGAVSVRQHCIRSSPRRARQHSQMPGAAR